MATIIENFKRIIAQYNSDIEKIAAKLNINLSSAFPKIIGELGQEAEKAYQNTSDDDLPSEQLYFTLQLKNEKQIKIHRRCRTRYPFPALFENQAFEHYNAQTIYENKEGNKKIVVMEGPSNKESAARMFTALRDNKITRLCAIGNPDEVSYSHFGYYKPEQPLDLGDFIVTAKQESKSEHVTTYQLVMRDKKTADEFVIKLDHNNTIDGAPLNFNLDELYEFYKNTKTDSVGIHCSAGRGRSSILAIAKAMADAGVFEKITYTEEYARLFLEICEKRFGLCQNIRQFYQIYVYGLACAAFKLGIKPDEFPEEFFRLPHAPQRASAQKENQPWKSVNNSVTEFSNSYATIFSNKLQPDANKVAEKSEPVSSTNTNISKTPPSPPTSPRLIGASTANSNKISNLSTTEKANSTNTSSVNPPNTQSQPKNPPNRFAGMRNIKI